MHEAATSQAIARFVLDESARQKAEKVLSVEIEIGRLSVLNPEQVEFWVKLCLENSVASDAEVRIAVIEPEVSCKVCGYTGPLEVQDDPMFHYYMPSFACPECGSGGIIINKGRGCVIRRIEMRA